MKNKYFYNKEKSTSLKRLKDEKKVVNEDNLSGGGNAHPWEEISKISVKIVEGEPVRLGGTGLFKTGSSVVDTNSVQYKDAVNILKWFAQNQGKYKGTVRVVGSASAVGSKGFDNFALAKKRAEALVNTIKKSPEAAALKGLTVVVDAIVGKATKANSPEALAEQCVYIAFSPIGEEKEFVYDVVQPIDNTATDVQPIKKSIKIPDEEKILNIDKGKIVRCGCCGRNFSESDRKSWVIDRYLWTINQLTNDWLKNKTGVDVAKWLQNMAKS
jgi:outer membrane protein OmpA-like peptidoglycan-associated protein